MKIHVCKYCGCTSFLVSAPAVQEWQVDAEGNYICCLDKNAVPFHRPTDGDIWECPECGKKYQGKDILVDGAAVIYFEDIDEEIAVYAEIIKRDRTCITIRPYIVSTAYECIHTLPSAYNQQTFNIWYKGDDVLYVKDEEGKSHLWSKVQHFYHTKEDIESIRKEQLDILKERYE